MGMVVCLQDHEVEKMFPLRAGSLPASNVQNIVFLTRPKLELMEKIAQNLHKWDYLDFLCCFIHDLILHLFEFPSSLPHDASVLLLDVGFKHFLWSSMAISFASCQTSQPWSVNSSLPGGSGEQFKHQDPLL